jgi:hypothetical protein
MQPHTAKGTTSNTLEPKVGDTVKYSKPLNTDEAGCRFVLVEHNGDRCLIRLICDLPIPPVECVPTSEIQSA